MQAKTKKVFNLVRAALTALIVSIAGTVAHQTSVNGAPIGVTVALIFVLALSLQARRNAGRLGAVVFSAVLAALVFWIGLDLHQDKMIPANNFGLAWAYGSIGLSALVVLWPRVGKASWSQRI